MKNTRLYLVATAIITLVILLAGTVCTTPTATPVPTATKAPTATTPPTLGPTPTPVTIIVTATPGPIGPTPTQGAPQILKIGNFGMTSGAGAAYGLATMRSQQMATEDVNVAGGFVVNGQRYLLQPVTVEAGYSVDTGRTAGERMVYSDGCKYIFGVGTADSLGIQEVTEKNNVLLFASAWSDPLVTNKPYTFRDMMGGDFQEMAIYGALKTKFPDKKKVYYQSTDTVTWRQGYDISIPMMEKLGYQTVGIDFADPNITDWYPAVTKIKNAKPDYVDMFMGAVYEGPFLKAADELGLHQATQIVWVVGDGVQNVLKVAGAKACEGVYFTQEWDWYGAGMSDTGKAFAKRYHDRFGDEETIHGFLGYDMVYGLIAAMQKANSLDPTVLKDILPDLKWPSASMGSDLTREFAPVPGANNRKAGMVYSQILGQYVNGKVVNMVRTHPTQPPVWLQ